MSHKDVKKLADAHGILTVQMIILFALEFTFFTLWLVGYAYADIATLVASLAAIYCWYLERKLLGDCQNE